MSKYFSLVIQIILVVAVVIALVVINPFNIFRSNKLSMTNTATMVESIKPIGQLISAEYYGEVIQSSTETVIKKLQSDADKMKAQLRFKELQLDSVIREILTNKPTLRNTDAFAREFASYRVRLKAESSEFKKLMDLYRECPEVRRIRLLAREDEPHITFFLYERHRDKKPFLVTQAILDEFVGEEYALDRGEERELERNKLVLLARGWVKAGIDLGTVEPGDLKYIEGEGRILMMRHSPKIISATINPWFIPNEKVLGFEFILIGDNFRKNSDNRDQLVLVQKLKSQCLQELEQQALNAKIMESAKANAEQSLSGFFSLLMEKNITVKLFSHPFEAYLDEFRRGDGAIQPHEFVSLDSLVSAYADSAFYQTVSFITASKAITLPPIQPEIDTCDWSARAKFIAITRDGLRTAEEEKLLADSTLLLGKRSYLYFLHAKHPKTLDKYINAKTPVTLDTLANAVKRDSTLTIAYDRYRQANETALINAVRKYTIVKKDR